MSGCSNCLAIQRSVAKEAALEEGPIGLALKKAGCTTVKVSVDSTDQLGLEDVSCVAPNPAVTCKTIVDTLKGIGEMPKSGLVQLTIMRNLAQGVTSQSSLPCDGAFDASGVRVGDRVINGKIY